MDRTALDAALVDELQRAHAAHTIILYGSHARGDATVESDIDVAAFADVTHPVRDARPWRGAVLDAFVYPNARADSPDADLLKLYDGRVLLDERGIAAPLLERLAVLEREGPPTLAEDEQRMRRAWARKMLARVRRGDVEAHYRRHWLLYQLLEDYFALRREWYRGPKQSLEALRRQVPTTFTAFERALDPSAPLAALAALVDHVVGPAT
jgi:predicted nucleotidyltransferase